MRAITLFATSILVIAFVFLPPGDTTGQGKKGGGFGGPRDPGQTFDFMAGGKPTIPVEKIPWGGDFAKQFAKEKGITNGQFTRDQYIEFSQASAAMRKAAFASGKMTAPGGGQFRMKGGAPGAGTPEPPPVQVNPDLIKQLADESFKRLDADKDGKLNQDEMPGRLRAQLDKWDKNSDGFIDINEYRDYFAAQLGGGVPGDNQTGRNIPSVVIDDDELDKKPVVFRAGKLPAGLPPWFKELDTDKDGQVALCEWNAAGKDLEEFKTWDLNNDGFITIDEALKVNLSAAKANGGAAVERPAFSGKNGKGKKGGGG